MSKEKETTFYAFNSNIRAFLSKLISSPIKASPSKFLTDRDFTKKKIINILLKRGILERHEKIDDEDKAPRYVVRYKVKKKDFEKKIHEIYSTYFDENEPEKGKINECDCGGCLGGGCDGELFGATTEDGSNGQYQTVINKKPIKKQEHIYEPKGKMTENKVKRIFITESQMEELQSVMNTPNAGDDILDEEEFASVGANNSNASGEYVKPFMSDSETADRTPGFSVKGKKWGEK